MSNYEILMLKEEVIPVSFSYYMVLRNSLMFDVYVGMTQPAHDVGTTLIFCLEQRNDLNPLNFDAVPTSCADGEDSRI